MVSKTKRYLIEGILGNESITDGLTDEHAQRIIAWCIARIEAYPSPDTQALAEFAHHLTQQARAIAKIANHVQDGDDTSRIKRRLQCLTADPTKQERFLGWLSQPPPLDECIQALMEMSEGD